MNWSPWSDKGSSKDDPGKTREKVVVDKDGTRHTHTMRTEDRTKIGDKNNHSHVIVTEKPDGTKAAFGHGIFKGFFRREDDGSAGTGE